MRKCKDHLIFYINTKTILTFPYIVVKGKSTLGTCNKTKLRLSCANESANLTATPSPVSTASSSSRGLLRAGPLYTNWCVPSQAQRGEKGG